MIFKLSSSFVFSYFFLALPLYSIEQVISFSVRKIAYSTNQFGLDLLRASDSNDNELVFCPFCISSSLVMLLMGSQGEMANALRHALYLYGMSENEINFAYFDMMNHLGVNLPTQKQSNSFKTSYPNSISNLYSINDFKTSAFTQNENQFINLPNFNSQYLFTNSNLFNPQNNLMYSQDRIPFGQYKENLHRINFNKFSNSHFNSLDRFTIPDSTINSDLKTSSYLFGKKLNNQRFNRAFGFKNNFWNSKSYLNPFGNMLNAFQNNFQNNQNNFQNQLNYQNEIEKFGQGANQNSINNLRLPNNFHYYNKNTINKRPINIENNQTNTTQIANKKTTISSNVLPINNQVTTNNYITPNNNQMTSNNNQITSVNNQITSVNQIPNNQLSSNNNYLSNNHIVPTNNQVLSTHNYLTTTSSYLVSTNNPSTTPSINYVEKKKIPEYPIKKIGNTDKSINYYSSKNGNIDLNNIDFGNDISFLSNIYVQRDFVINYHYHVLLQKFYKTAIHPLDFIHNGEETRQHINAYVQMQTNNKISNILPERQLPSTQLLLISALYFKGELDLNLNLTKKSTKLNELSYNYSEIPKTNQLNKLKENEETWMEAKRTRLRYAFDKYLNCSTIEMPFKDGLITLVLMVPNEKNGLKTLLTKLNAQMLNDVVNSLEIRRLTIKLPKINIENSFRNLTMALSNLGLSDLFRPGHSQLNNVSDFKWLYVSDIIHKTHLNIKESSSSNQQNLKSRSKSDDQSDIDIELNKPFLFFIMDTVSGLIMSMGKIDKESLNQSRVQNLI